MHHIVAIDIDGCLTKKYAAMDLSTGTPDWSRYFTICLNAVPDRTLPDMVRELSRSGYTIYLVTSRPELVRWHTKAWLSHHNIPFHRLIMNEGAYATSDVDFKKSLFDKGILHDGNLVAFFDDNPDVVEMLRKEGHNAHQHETLMF